MDPTPANLQILFTGIQVAYAQAYLKAEVWYDQIATTMPSSTELNLYAWPDLFPAMKEWLGPRVVHSLPTRSRSVVNKKWVDTISIPRTKIVDDQYGIYSFQMAMLAKQAKKLHDQQLALMIQSNPTGFDGVAFFNTAHPVDIDAGTGGPLSSFSNDLTTTALTPTNYGAARAAMRGFIGRDGNPFMAKPSLLIVPPQLEEAAKLILQADFIAAKAFGNMTDNVGSETNVWKNSAQLLVIEELQNQAKVWYLVDNTNAVRPFIVQNREAATMVPRTNPTDDNVFWQDEFVWGVMARSAYDVTIPHFAIRCGSSL